MKYPEPGNRRERVLLFTGGLDSTIMHTLLGEPPCLYVALEQGFPAEAKNLSRLWDALPIDLDVIDAPLPSAAKVDGHIPLRNLHLATIGALITDRVMIGAVRGESSPDKSEKFLRRASAALTEASQGRKITVEAPLRHLTKRQLVKAFIQQVGRQEAERIFSLTRSCYSEHYDRCGRCMACFRRWVALYLNGIEEAHENPPWEMIRPSWRDRLEYLRWAPLPEWPGIAESNLEALAALDLRRRRAAQARGARVRRIAWAPDAPPAFAPGRRRS